VSTVRPKRKTVGSADQADRGGGPLLWETLATQHLAVMSLQIDWQTGCSSIDRAMRFATRFRLDRRMSMMIAVQPTLQFPG
jgi:hypothetical protein